MIRAREVEETDWPRIQWLASDEVQEADHSGLDDEWTRRRKAFAGERFHSVLESDSDVVGYCSLERAANESKEGFRAFLVADWGSGNEAIHDALFQQLECLVDDAGASQVWMRELEGDRALIDFLISRGFVIEKRYQLDNLRLVNLTREYGDGAA